MPLEKGGTDMSVFGFGIESLQLLQCQLIGLLCPGSLLSFGLSRTIGGRECGSSRVTRRKSGIQVGMGEWCGQQSSGNGTQQCGEWRNVQCNEFGKQDEYQDQNVSDPSLAQQESVQCVGVGRTNARAR